ncbi:hypothetical protein C8T65DRAFT_581962 [Cerioporus squamosus]|nr:hypothetical protein C8T65DRAFT_581962 [Cerioporus squamosus]
MAFYQPQSAVEQIKRHPKYYLNGGDVHFLVENYIYRVHRYFFERESAWFREKLSAPSPAGQQPKGSSDANPFPLDDVVADDFSKFLWVFYNPKYSIYDATLEDWIAILKLAFDWRFGEIKKLCTRHIEKFEIAPVPKIELYQQYELDKKLLIPSFLYLCMRQEPLSLKEGRQIGLETALLVATARECARGKPLGNGARSPTAAELEEDDMVSIINSIFGLSAGPPSPSLTPLERGTGVATFAGTPVTSPRKQLDPARQPPPLTEVVSLKATNSQSQSLPTTKEQSPPPQSVPSISKPTPPTNGTTNGVRSPPPPPNPMATWGSNVGTLLGSAVNDFLGSSASPTVAPSTPTTEPPPRRRRRTPRRLRLRLQVNPPSPLPHPSTQTD